jgi:hypothetical protein
MPAPTPATDAELAALVMEVLKDPAAYRRFLGRLRPRLVGRPHPHRRLPKVRGVLRCSKAWLKPATINRS